MAKKTDTTLAEATVAAEADFSTLLRIVIAYFTGTGTTWQQAMEAGVDLLAMLVKSLVTGPDVKSETSFKARPHMPLSDEELCKTLQAKMAVGANVGDGSIQGISPELKKFALELIMRLLTRFLPF